METWDLDALQVEPHHPLVLHTADGAARIIAINLPAGEDLEDHQVHEHAYLAVHRGAVRLEAGGESRDVTPGVVAHWQPQERHAVTAIDDALIVLFLAPWPGPGHPSLRARAD